MPDCTRRTVAFGLASAVFAPVVLRAQSPFPFSGPITIVAGFPAGGSSDLMARLVAERLQATLGRPVIVENQAGAGGMIAARGVQTATADGSRLLLANTSIMVLTPLAFADAGYDPLNGFAPIASAAEFPVGLATGPMTGAQDLNALTAWIRANPAQANYGVPALGSLPHLTAIAYSRAINVPFQVVPYRGGAPIAQDLLGGRLAMGLGATADFAAQHRGGQVRLVAATGTRRAPGLPDIPTFAEQGLAGFEANAWSGFFAPAAMPAPLVATLETVILAVLAEPDVRQRLEQAGFLVAPRPGTELRAALLRDRAALAPLLAAAGPLQ